MTKDQLEKLNKEYKELSTVFGNLSEKFKKIKGNYTAEKAVDVANVMDDLVSNVSRRIDYIHQRIDYLSNDLHNHFDAHLPKLTAGQLEKLLKAAGASEDFEIKRKIIYANLGRNPILEVSYSPPKTT